MNINAERHSSLLRDDKVTRPGVRADSTQDLNLGQKLLEPIGINRIPCPLCDTPPLDILNLDSENLLNGLDVPLKCPQSVGTVLGHITGHRLQQILFADIFTAAAELVHYRA